MQLNSKFNIGRLISINRELFSRPINELLLLQSKGKTMGAYEKKLCTEYATKKRKKKLKNKKR